MAAAAALLCTLYIHMSTCIHTYTHTHVQTGTERHITMLLRMYICTHARNTQAQTLAHINTLHLFLALIESIQKKKRIKYC